MADLHGAGMDRNHHDIHSPTCPSCGSPTQSQTRIDSLENEVSVLTEQSIAAANKLTSYEEEIRALRSQRSATQAETTQAHAHSASLDSAPDAASRPAQIYRFASFRGMGRKTSGPSTGTSVDLSDLQTQLARETALRQEAEKKVAQANGELEDLSAQLFEQANEMVATERKARAKLEERVAMLEQRDRDKTKRLERIEGALKRLERVKMMLGT